MNGAAARLVHPDDLIIICCFAHLQDQEIKGHQIRIVHVNDENRVKEVVTTDIMSTWATPLSDKEPSDQSSHERLPPVWYSVTRVSKNSFPGQIDGLAQLS